MAKDKAQQTPDTATPLDDTALDAVQGGLSKTGADGKTGIVLHEESESLLMEKKLPSSPGSNFFDEADSMFGKR